MTLSTTTSRVSYVGTGTTGPFPVPFRFVSNADLVVIVRDGDTDAETTLALNSDYTVSGAGNATGTVTLTNALATGDILAIRRVPDVSQNASFAGQAEFRGSSHEAALDYIVMIAQDLRERTNRSFRLPPSYDPATISKLVKPETGKALVWQSLTELGNSLLDAGAIAIPGSGRTVDSLSAYLLNNAIYNVKDFGATGDGATDDRAGVVLAKTAALSSGAEVLFVNGTYLIGSNLTITSPTVFRAGATIKPANGVTVTLAGEIVAGLFQIFDLSAGGSVAVRKGQVVRPEWWGTADGAISSAVSAVNTAGGGTVLLDYATYSYSATLAIGPVSNNVNIIGPATGRTSGATLATLSYTGAGQAITMTNASGCVFENFLVTNAGTGTIGIWLSGCLSNRFTNIAIPDGFATDAWRLDTSFTQSTIYNTFQNCTGICTNGGGTGVGLRLTEATNVAKATNNNTFVNCYFGNSDVGIQVDTACNENIWIGVELGQCTTALQAMGGRLVFLGANIESCTTGISVPTGADDGLSIVMWDVNLSGNTTNYNNVDGAGYVWLQGTQGIIRDGTKALGSIGGGSTQPDPRKHDYYTATLTGNQTISNPATSARGQEVTFDFTQDGTGGRVITFGSNYVQTWSPNTAAGKRNIISFRNDGSKWVQKSATTGL